MIYINRLCGQDTINAAVVRSAQPHNRNYRDLRWLPAICKGLRHVPYLLEVLQDNCPVGYLPLSFVKSKIFGRFLVSLPYVNTAGVVARNARVAQMLIDDAIALADELDVRYLELRHEVQQTHAALKHVVTDKVHMRLDLPSTPDELWTSFKPKIRNQIRKGEKGNLSVCWGRLELLDGFYDVFSVNMRDLGTPVFARSLFREILNAFGANAECCVVKMDRRPVAAALLVHGDGVTEVPSASSLRQYNSTNANMLMYWNLLTRAIERQQATFDFGRSTVGSNTFNFKKQWGASPHEAVWQYYHRSPVEDRVRPDSPKYQRMIRIWQRLPLFVTRILGPRIVRGIP